jgi:hypothetical protein
VRLPGQPESPPCKAYPAPAAAELLDDIPFDLALCSDLAVRVHAA